MEVGVPAWLSVDRDKLEGKVLADPTTETRSIHLLKSV